MRLNARRLDFMSSSFLITYLPIAAVRRHRHGPHRRHGSLPCWRTHAIDSRGRRFRSYRFQRPRTRFDSWSSGCLVLADCRHGLLRHRDSCCWCLHWRLHDSTCPYCPRRQPRGSLRLWCRRWHPCHGRTNRGFLPAAAGLGSAAHSPVDSAWSRPARCHRIYLPSLCRSKERHHGAAGCAASCCFPR